MINHEIVTTVVKSKKKNFGDIAHVPEFDFVAFVTDGNTASARFFKDGKLVKVRHLEGVYYVSSGFFEYPKIFAIGTRLNGEHGGIGVLISFDYHTEAVVRDIPGSNEGLHIRQTKEGDYGFWCSYKNTNGETLISGKDVVNLGRTNYLRFGDNSVVYGNVDKISEYIVE